jgi:hypothetical protein
MRRQEGRRESYRAAISTNRAVAVIASLSNKMVIHGMTLALRATTIEE